MFQIIETCFFLVCLLLIIQQKSWIRQSKEAKKRKIIHKQCLMVFKSCSSIFPATLRSHFKPKPAPYMTGICVFSPYNATHNKQQSAGPVCCLSRLSLVDRTLPCLLARHQVAAIAVTLPSSPFLFLSLCIGWMDWTDGGFLCVAGERRH